MDLYANRMLGMALIFGRDYEAALEQARKTLEIAPSYFPARWDEVQANQMLGRLVDALQASESVRTLAPQDPVTLAVHAFIQSAAGREEDALCTIEQLKSMRSQRYVGAMFISWAYPLVDLDKAFEWLEIALEERDGMLVMLKHFPPWAAEYAKDPRLPDVLRRIGMP